MPSPPLVALCRCCAIWGVTPIAWPFQTIACWPSRKSASPSGGKQGKMTLVATEFFFLHVLPKGFVRIRHFGFLTNRLRVSSLALCQQLLSSSSPGRAEAETCQIPSESSSLWHCPRCGAAMIVIQRFTAANCQHVLTSILRSAFLIRPLQTCSRTPIHSCVHLPSTRSHATFRARSCRHLRRSRRSPRSLSNSPVLFQLSTGYQTAIQIP